jgi:hypothetical protein
VYLHADDLVLTKRIVRRGDEFVVPQKLPSISRKYEQVLQSVSLPILSYDTGEYTSDEIADDLVLYLQTQK